MAARDQDQAFTNNPGFDHGASMLLFKSNLAIPRSDTTSPQTRIENESTSFDHDLKESQPPSSPQSVNSSETRQTRQDLAAENSRLRAKIETMESRQENMVTDFVKTKSEIRAKDTSILGKQRIIDNQHTEMEHLRALQNNTQNSIELQKTVDQLTTEVREKDLHLRERVQILRERDFEIRDCKSQLEQEQKLREKDTLNIQQLHHIVNSLETSARTRDSSELDFERTRAQSLQHELDDLRTAHTTTISQIETQEAHKQKLTQELQSLQASHQRTVAESQLLEQLKASSADELAEARRMASFFKKNSEATSRKAKGLEAEVKSLMGVVAKQLGRAETDD